MTTKSHCDLEKISQLLSGTISPPAETQLEAHLETCDTCRGRLEDSASDLVDWTAAAKHLRDDENDGSVSAATQMLRRLNGKEDLRQAVEIRSTDSATAVVIRQIVGWLDPTDDPRMLGRLGGYEIAGVVGSGGMGVVLKGFDASLNRFVAIKLLAPHLAGNGASRQRFAREAQAAAAVVHENVIAIHSVSEFNDLPYLVMPYVRGMSLQKRVDVEGPLDIAEVLRIGMQTASGLAAAHAQGLVHRDIKPANILLADGVARVTITDFGLAQAADDASLTHSGMIAGTPQYMSPEQASGASVDHHSDLFSLGSLMYAMCAGRPPFRAESAYGILKRIAEDTARPIQDVNPKVPNWLANIIEKLHARQPSDRFQSATEVERILSDCLAHVQQPTRVALPPELKTITRMRKQDNSRWSLVAASLLVCGTVGFAGWWMSDPDDPIDELSAAFSQSESDFGDVAEVTPEASIPYPADNAIEGAYPIPDAADSGQFPADGDAALISPATSDLDEDLADLSADSLENEVQGIDNELSQIEFELSLPPSEPTGEMDQ